MNAANTPARKPEWIRTRLNTTEDFRQVRQLLSKGQLHTVCEEAKCPNIQECWGTHKTATFMILGDTCTRRCRFCAVKTGLPRGLDLGEPARVADSVREMGLKHVVVTMVNRDDLRDGGSGIMANTVRAIRHKNPGTTIEVLASDMMGRRESIVALVEGAPEILSHNMETVRRLTPLVRSRSDYDRSLEFHRIARDAAPAGTIALKSSIMLGLGETVEEIHKVMDDLLEAGVTLMNIGQYLQPTKTHIPVAKFWKPEEFDELKEVALAKGFVHVEAAPLVRSSYHAGEQLAQYRKNYHPLNSQ